jgi:hypothetical protein
MTNGAPGDDDLDAEGFLEKVQNTFKDLVEVKVVTIVGDVPVTITTKGDSTQTTIGDEAISGKALITVVKLLDGDVTTAVPKEHLGNAELRAMHTEQVARSLEVIPRNLNTLVDMAKNLLGRNES